MKRPMHLAAFLIAGPVAHSHALWRHPESDHRFLDIDYYMQLGELLETGCFDFAFFADRLGVSDRFGGSYDLSLRYGDQDATRLDPLLVLAAMATRTRYLGLAATRSTTYHEPYNVARAFATLDHLSRGRAAWNVVTSMTDSEARNFGASELLEHDERYDRADEFMQIVTGLWDGWDSEALVLDRERGHYADPSAVHPLAHSGRFFEAHGLLNMPRSPQGRPLILQAGSSGRGRAFAARWSDAIFALQPTVALMQQAYAQTKAAVVAAGREPDDCRVLVAVMPFVADSASAAAADRDAHNALVDPLVGLSTLSNHANHDFSEHDLDRIVAADDVDIRGTQGLLGTVLRFARAEQLTLREVGRRYGASVFVPQIAGTPSEIADQLEDIVAAGGADGFMISPATLPGSLERFVQRVVPELQRRGCMPRDYRGATLRERFGLRALVPTASGRA